MLRHQLGQCEHKPAGVSGEAVHSFFGTVRDNRPGASAP